MPGAKWRVLPPLVMPPALGGGIRKAKFSVKGLSIFGAFVPSGDHNSPLMQLRHRVCGRISPSFAYLRFGQVVKEGACIGARGGAQRGVPSIRAHAIHQFICLRSVLCTKIIQKILKGWLKCRKELSGTRSSPCEAGAHVELCEREPFLFAYKNGVRCPSDRGVQGSAVCHPAVPKLYVLFHPFFFRKFA